MYAIQNAKSQNYSEFYKTEISRREIFDYPPYCQIIKIVISSTDEVRAAICANETAENLKKQTDKFKLSEYISVSNSMKCIMQKINSEYRYQIIIKNKLGKKGHYLISKFTQGLTTANDIKLVTDIDPIDII